MQLTNSPSALPTSTIDTASLVSAPIAVETPVDAPAESLDAPADTSTAAAANPVEAPTAAATPNVLFGPDQFTIQPFLGTVLASHGIFSVFHTPKDNGYDITTETFEFSKVAKGTGVASDEFTGKHKISKETYTSVKAKDLPAWAVALTAAPLDLPFTLEGSAGIVVDAPKSDISVVTTPVRSGTVDNVTTPTCSGSLNSLSTPNEDTAVKDLASGAKSLMDDTPESLPGTINTSREGMQVNSGKTHNTKTRSTKTRGTKFTKTAAPGALLFESMNVPKPVLSNELDKTERREAIISFAFNNIQQSSAAAKAFDASVISPPASPAAPANADSEFSAFTPNTTKLFADCEALHSELSALPSLTPMFEAAFKSSACECQAIAAMNSHTVAPAPTAGPSTAVASPSTSRAPAFKKIRLVPNPVVASATVRSVSGSGKRTIYDVSSGKEEVTIIETASTAKGKCKVQKKVPKGPKGPKKHKAV